MHQLTPTYKQAVHLEMAAILQPPPLTRKHAKPASRRLLMERLESTAARESTGLGWEDVHSAPLSQTARTNGSDSRLVNKRPLFSRLIKTPVVLAIDWAQTRDWIKNHGLVLLLVWNNQFKVWDTYFSYWLIMFLSLSDWLNKRCTSDWVLETDERRDFREVMFL